MYILLGNYYNWCTQLSSSSSMKQKKLHYCCGYISHYLQSDNCYHQKENPVACYNPELTKGNKYSKKKNIYIMCIYILVTKRSKCPKPEISFP